MKIVFLDQESLGGISLEPIKKLGDYVGYSTSTHLEAIERVKDCDVLIVNKVEIDKDILDAASNLKLICEAATGVNNIDIQECKKRNIPVKNVVGYSTYSVAQLTFAMILSLICKLPYFDKKVKSGEYSKSGLFTDVTSPYTELWGKTLGIVGLGAIGKKVAEIGKALGMNIIYYSTSGTYHCKEYEGVTLEDLLRRSDIISIHAPLNENTRGLINENNIKFVRPNSIIVNMGRGGIINEDVIADAINNELIAGACLDVYQNEPLPLDSPLLRVKYPDRLRLTPHLGWASTEALNRLVGIVAQNIREEIR